MRFVRVMLAGKVVKGFDDMDIKQAKQQATNWVKMCGNPYVKYQIKEVK